MYERACRILQKCGALFLSWGIAFPRRKNNGCARDHLCSGLVVSAFSGIIDKIARCMPALTRDKEQLGMSNVNELNNRINARYSSMSKGQKMLANYITDNYDKAVFLTAAKLGRLSVSANPRWYASPCAWDTRDIRIFRRRWRRWCATS